MIYKDLNCKALLDKVITRTEDSGFTVIEPYDIKTVAGNPLFFNTSVDKFRYDIQAVFYTKALEFWAREKFGVDNFRIEKFKFLVAPKEFESEAMLFEIDSSYMRLGEYGREPVMQDDVIISRSIFGVNDLINLHNLYSTTNWKSPKSIIGKKCLSISKNTSYIY